MTKKHFNAIANALRERYDKTRDDSVIHELEQVAIALADQFEVFNPNFNRSYFLAVALG